MVNDRTRARLEARIKERVAHCIEFELNDPRAAFITLTTVELARDISTVKVLYSVLGGDADRSKAAHMLASATGFVQRQLGRVLRTRRIPRIQWFYDDSIEKIDRMERVIRGALESDQEVNPEAHSDLRPKGTSEDDLDLAETEYEEFLSEQDED